MKGKRGFILGAAVVTLGINFATIFGGTYAWFMANKEITASGMAVKAANPNNVLIVEKHIYSWDYTADEPIETQDLNLEPYDCFITTRNTYARKFLWLKLQYPNGIPEDSALNISVDCTGALYTTIQNNQYVDTNISNLIQFKYFDNKEGTIDTSNVSSIYADCQKAFGDINSMDTFVTLDNSEESVSATKDSNTIENEDISLETTTDQAFTTNLFIEYTYNEDLLDFYQKNSAVEFDLNVFTGATKVEFIPDVTKMSIDVNTLM